MNTTLSLAPLFRTSIGFDPFSDLFEATLRGDVSSSYPPYNVEKHGDNEYRIVLAAAGLRESDLDIQVERGVLTIGSSRREQPVNGPQYLHQGIAQRAFKLSFRLADYIEVKDAQLEHGLLKVNLERRIPDEAKPRRISVASSFSADSGASQSSNTVAMERKAA